MMAVILRAENDVGLQHPAFPFDEITPSRLN
jgi:hypothetical protein